MEIQPFRTCGACGLQDIPFGVDWRWWCDGRPVHQACHPATVGAATTDASEPAAPAKDRAQDEIRATLRERARSYMYSSGGSAMFREDDRERSGLAYALIVTLMDNDWRIPDDAPAIAHGEGGPHTARPRGDDFPPAAAATSVGDRSMIDEPAQGEK